MQKKVGLIGVLVLLCGVSAYMWMSNSGTETDTTIAGMKETWKCPECGKEFELTAAQATAMLRTTRHEIVCPYCKKGGAEREGQLLSMEGGAPSGGDGDFGDDEAEEPDEEAPPQVKGTMGPIRP